jgi:AraC family transcriptional regulator of adaptative response/methylated-DNA-[protein]-cysteine methyltransferase
MDARYSRTDAQIPLAPPYGAVRFLSDASRWKAVQKRNAAADSYFLYSVATTGVYCRPSCAARAARRENVAFHATREDAERAGFRACKRCRPDLPPRAEREAAVVAAACRALEQSENPLSLQELAARAALSPWHFHRLFKRITGVTPRAYAHAQRQRRAQKSLLAGTAVTEAIYAAGFNSSGRFYESAADMLGMRPTAYRKGGKGEALWHAVAPCSLGLVLVAATERGVCAIILGDDPGEMQAEVRRRFPQAALAAAPAGFARTVQQVARCVDDPRAGARAELPLDIRGTAFQRRVWEELRKVPPGETASYSEIAARIGQPRSVRAVAGACAANHLAVAIPCHRIVGADGKLTGYRWGIERKRLLLEREGKSPTPPSPR